MINQSSIHRSAAIKNRKSTPSLNKAKSSSMTNLLPLQYSNYDHIESKVKKYIQNYKNTDSKSQYDTGNKKHNQPSKPLKKNCITLPIESLEKVCSVQTSPIKQVYKEVPTSENVIGKLSNMLLEERKSRIEQNETLSALQLSYDNLLAEYAEAKNVIDSLRVTQETLPGLNLSYRTSRDVQMPRSSTPDMFHLRRAFSTSHLSESLPKAMHSSTSKLVETSFVPSIDPKMSISINLQPEKDTILSSGYVSQENFLDLGLISSIHEPSQDPITYLDAIISKLKQYVLLENNNGITEDERQIFWKQSFFKYNDLVDCSKNTSHVSQEFASKLTELKCAMDGLSAKYLTNQQYEDEFISGRNQRFCLPSSNLECSRLAIKEQESLTSPHISNGNLALDSPNQQTGVENVKQQPRQLISPSVQIKHQFDTVDKSSSIDVLDSHQMSSFSLSEMSAISETAELSNSIRSSNEELSSFSYPTASTECVPDRSVPLQELNKFAKVRMEQSGSALSEIHPPNAFTFSECKPSDKKRRNFKESSQAYRYDTRFVHQSSVKSSQSNMSSISDESSNRYLTRLEQNKLLLDDQLKSMKVRHQHGKDYQNPSPLKVSRKHDRRNSKSHPLCGYNSCPRLCCCMNQVTISTENVNPSTLSSQSNHFLYQSKESNLSSHLKPLCCIRHHNVISSSGDKHSNHPMELCQIRKASSTNSIHTKVSQTSTQGGPLNEVLALSQSLKSQTKNMLKFLKKQP